MYRTAEHDEASAAGDKCSTAATGDKEMAECRRSPGAAFLPLRLAGLPDSSLLLLLTAGFLPFLAAFGDPASSLSLSLPADLYSESDSESEAGSDAEASSGEALLRFGMCAA